MPADHPSKLARVERLQQYLREDPDNGQLLAQTCDAAIEAGADECARNCIASARARNLSPAEWAPRSAHLALLHFQRGDMARSRSELAPWLGPGACDPESSATQAAMQVLWLRATHQCGLAGEASRWAAEADRQESLSPLAAGVASLAAVDAGDFTLAAKLADRALQAGTPSSEALVARASVALAQGHHGLARSLLEQALAACPDDGRSLSAMGLVYLQGRELAAARACFTRALVKLPEHIGSWHGLGWACLLQGDRPAAAEAFDSALRIDRNFAESQGAVGLMLLLAGRQAEALHHLALADRLDPRNATARYARALASGDVRDVQALRALATRLLDRPGLFGGNLRDEFSQLAD